MGGMTGRALVLRWSMSVRRLESSANVVMTGRARLRLGTHQMGLVGASVGCVAVRAGPLFKGGMGKSRGRPGEVALLAKLGDRLTQEGTEAGGMGIMTGRAGPLLRRWMARRDVVTVQTEVPDRLRGPRREGMVSLIFMASGTVFQDGVSARELQEVPMTLQTGRCRLQEEPCQD
jgi:hypothetical protein